MRSLGKTLSMVSGTRKQAIILYLLCYSPAQIHFWFPTAGGTKSKPSSLKFKLYTIWFQSFVQHDFYVSLCNSILVKLKLTLLFLYPTILCLGPCYRLNYVSPKFHMLKS